MKQVTKLALALIVGMSGVQYAAAMDSHAGHGAAAQGDMAPAELAAGEIKKIDKSAGKITIKHGRLYRLDMAPMTMAFRVSDPKMLDQVQVGDKIRFDADKVKGALTVVKMEAVK
jgi:Cu(I)/Ag(I) efflux system periplasmic protein CusF